LIHFSLESELPGDFGPFQVKDVFGGREKVVFVEIEQVSAVISVWVFCFVVRV
jgi:hypothetical protein